MLLTRLEIGLEVKIEDGVREKEWSESGVPGPIHDSIMVRSRQRRGVLTKEE